MYPTPTTTTTPTTIASQELERLVCVRVRGVYLACCTWLEEQGRGGTERSSEVRRRDGGGARRRMVGSWIEAKVCEAGKLRAVFCFAAF